MPDDKQQSDPRLRRILRSAITFGGGAVAMLGLLGAALPPLPAPEAASLTVMASAGPMENGMESARPTPSNSRLIPSPSPSDETSPVKGATDSAHGTKIRSRSPHALRRRADCPPTSVVCIENSLPGTPPSQWDVPTQSTNIEGYVTQMSVNKGENAQFKVNTNATNYRIDIYRIGYYGGMGARLITTIEPSAALPQTQPACLGDTTTGLIDCGNWGLSASWPVPNDAVSGVYAANLIREDGTAGTSQILFIIRDDSRNSDILLQTSDTTWQAYNQYGGNSLYLGKPVGRAYKVSYNRPLFTRSSFFMAEYPLVRWIEANGYDVSYTSSVDTASRGAELLEHKIFVSSGHDEYWSNETRNNVQNARDNGVSLIFLSGNQVFWKTRWENSLDATGTPFRTLVCYKETHANAKIDPSPQWTGTWRDPRFSPPSDGGRPENALSGTFFMVNTPANDAISVSAEYSDMRLWRNTSIASLQPGQTATFPVGTLGYEWDEATDNGFAPAGLVKFSKTTLVKTSTYLLNFGSTYGAGTPTHSLTLYRHASGALVFGTGTVQWSWGLDDNHDLKPAGGGRLGGTPPTDIRMQQATVNLLADMKTQPASIQPGLVPAVASTDTTPPTSAITYPASGGTVPAGTVIPVQGTAADTGGGVVGGVEVSFDGGTRWFQATGRTSWRYNWTTPSSGTVTVKSRAVDDIGNIQGTPTELTVTVVPGCSPCSIWPPSAVPAIQSQPDANASTAGVKFKAATAGTINSIRFYKGPQNTGTHVGSLWTSSGQLLASATFTNETASGWQQVNFPTPVNIAANTTYIASYHTTSGFYSVTRPYFTTQYTNSPLLALANGAEGGNGVYKYGATDSFPTASYQASNYWVDVVFTPSNSLWNNAAVPAVQSQPDANASTAGVKFKAATAGTINGIRFYKGPQNTGTHVGSLWTSSGQLLASATFTNETASGWQQVNFPTPVNITANTTYIASYYTTSGFYSVTRPYFTTQYMNSPLLALANGAEGGNGVYKYGATNSFPTDTYQASNYWVDVVFTPSNSLWDNTVVPAVQSQPDTSAITLGVKFKTTTAGTIDGIRFYKGPQNTGTHTGSLWTTDGQLLASAVFTNETASGWQQVNFPTPVEITPNTTYIASYHTTSGYWSVTRPYFTTQYANGPLIALADGAAGGNGVYRYGAVNNFPVNSNQSSNYWVDVVFTSP
ncbi:DUF4082 domain-containing protein [Streptosporangium amethystogenes subsp. fukuiense]|uniref:DUF4082 domain-containing protein n=2 Tax=Streptosporangium amethystogenes TaxID=2002 RepID=A0ABW2STH8_9ACTN